MTVSVGVIGAGGHSTGNHGPALARCAEESRDVVLRAVCDLDADAAESYAESFGFEATYRDYDRMLDEEPLDAAVAVTPIEATRTVAGDLLERGVPVLVEKPPGRDSEETRELREIAARHGTDHAVSFNRRFNPAVTWAREWLADADSPPTLLRARQYRADRLEPGFVVNTGIHAVDAVCSFLGRPTRVSSRRWRSRPGGGESCEAHVRFGDDASASIAMAPDAGRHAETYELVGPDYTVRVDAGAAQCTVWSGGETVLSRETPADAPAYERNGALDETRAFLAAVRDGEGFSPTLDDGLASMEAAEAIDEGGVHDLAPD